MIISYLYTNLYIVVCECISYEFDIDGKMLIVARIFHMTAATNQLNHC